MIKAEPSWTLRGPAVRNVPFHGLLLLRAGDNPIIHERAGTFLTIPQRVDFSLRGKIRARLIDFFHWLYCTAIFAR